jgi:hypothetical protein
MHSVAHLCLADKCKALVRDDQHALFAMLEKAFFFAPDPEEVALDLFVPVDQLYDRRADTVLIIY